MNRQERRHAISDSRASIDLDARNFTKTFTLLTLICLVATLLGCTDRPPPPLPLFAEKPIVVRISDSENLVEWNSEPETAYTLHWRTDDRFGGEITAVDSPYVHVPGSNDVPVYYSLSTPNTRPGMESASLLFHGAPMVARIYVTVGDINGDGCLEVMFTLNDCSGRLMPLTAAQMGIEEVHRSGRSLRDLRLADFNRDGIEDLVTNSYEEFGPAAPPALLFLGAAGGIFVNAPAFNEIGARGRGETIVVADFDNDNDTDIYLPFYTHESPEAQNFLLINDGFANFHDVADEAGVAMRNVPIGQRVEGVQALDFDFDGDIDIAAATDLFLNQLNDTGELSFVSFPGFPQGFDEGIKFLDWDNDGDFDLIRQRPNDDIGPLLYEFEDNEFTEVVDAFPPGTHQAAFGLNAYDLNLDGREDVISSGGRRAAGEDALPYLYVNAGDRFVESAYASGGFSNVHDVSAIADFDGDDMPDFAARVGAGAIYTNLAEVRGAIRILVLGPNGERNQYGRPVRIYSLSSPQFVMTRAVDGGSGYLSNNQYELIVGVPGTGGYTIEVQFADKKVVVPVIFPGTRLSISENGQFEILGNSQFE